ncbi:R3H domain-containing protein 1 [Bienertia sinuspersici]
MSITQFAMVEELASLIKDNFSSRYLVLAVEEALVKYLQGDPSPDGILELEPMSSYNRLIIHRLADIFGPSILVSDILWQYDACESPPIPYQLLKRDEACTGDATVAGSRGCFSGVVVRVGRLLQWVLKMNLVSSPNIVEREAAYLAARERIFGVDEVDLKEAARQKPRNVPVVARRMIAHALGHRIDHCGQAQSYDVRHSNGETTMDNIEKTIKVNLDSHPETFLHSSVCADKKVKYFRAEGSANNSCSPVAHKEPNKNTSVVPQPSGRNRLTTSKMSMRDENMGAAKRMFANALGMQASKDGVSHGKVKVIE